VLAAIDRGVVACEQFIRQMAQNLPPAWKFFYRSHDDVAIFAIQTAMLVLKFCAFQRGLRRRASGPA
jgi:hypothetical protein